MFTTLHNFTCKSPKFDINYVLTHQQYFLVDEFKILKIKKNKVNKMKNKNLKMELNREMVVCYYTLLVLEGHQGVMSMG